MKQLLICKGSSTKYGRTATSDSAAAVTVATLNTLYDGAIVLFGGNTIYQASPTSNFSIALGRGAGNAPFIIPEVDIETLTVTKALPKVGTTFKRVFTFPTPVVGNDYGIMFIKKDVVPHQRNTFCVGIVAGTTTAATEAAALVSAINNSYGSYFTASNSGANITVVAKTEGDEWEAKLLDGLKGQSFAGSTDYVNGTKAVGDKAFIEELASKCAADKGFRYTDAEGAEIYKGYPEAVESFTLNTSGASGTSTAGYALFTLRFATKRDAGKTTDERVWQVVHIAVPVSSGSSTTAYYHLNNYLPEGKYTDNIINAATTTALAGKANASNG